MRMDLLPSPSFFLTLTARSGCNLETRKRRRRQRRLRREKCEASIILFDKRTVQCPGLRITHIPRNAIELS